MFTGTEVCDVWYALSKTLDEYKKRLEKNPLDLDAQSGVNRFTPLEERTCILMNQKKNEWVEWDRNGSIHLRVSPDRVSASDKSIKFAKEFIAKE
jgi:hypothetical protein